MEPVVKIWWHKYSFWKLDFHTYTFLCVEIIFFRLKKWKFCPNIKHKLHGRPGTVNSCSQQTLGQNPWWWVRTWALCMGARIGEPVKTSSWVLELAIPSLLSNIRSRGTLMGTLQNSPLQFAVQGRFGIQITPQGSLLRIPEPLTDYGKGCPTTQQIKPSGSCST
jgi:hypothetical protein